MKKFLKNPWTISVVTAIFSFLLTVFYDLIKGKQILSTVSSLLNTIWSAVISFFNFELKVWWVLIGIVCLFAILWCISKYYDYKDNDPPFITYTQDSIQGWNWQWIWQKDLYGKYDIKNLHPVCSKCDTPLVNSNRFDASLECLRCGHKYKNYLPDFDNIKIIIADNVHRNMYSKEGDAK